MASRKSEQSGTQHKYTQIKHFMGKTLVSLCQFQFRFQLYFRKSLINFIVCLISLNNGIFILSSHNTTFDVVTFVLRELTKVSFRLKTVTCGSETVLCSAIRCGDVVLLGSTRSRRLGFDKS